MVVARHQPHAAEAACLQVSKQLMIRRLALGIGDLHGEDLPVPVRAHPGDNEHALTDDLPALAHMLIAGVHAQIRIDRVGERTIPPGVEFRIQLPGQLGDEALGEAGAAQCFGDLTHVAGGDAFEVHLHEGEHERLPVALVAGEELRGEGAVPILRHLQRQCADAGVQLAGFVAVAVAAPRRASLVRFGMEMRGHLRFEHRLEYALDEDAQEIGIVGQNGLCRCGDAGTLFVGHRLPPSSRSVATTDRGGRWPPVIAAPYLQKIPDTTSAA